MLRTEVTVRYGRNGTNGQTNVKNFPDLAGAAKHVEKLVGEKTGKGYVEVP
jgi:predicted DNA-binding WGR domain protein